MGKLYLGGEGAKYQQVKDNIKRWILAGQVDSDGKILSEHNMSRLFGVSRHTVRQAVGDLVNEGWLHREQGRGTFAVRWGKRSAGAKSGHFRIGVITTYLSDYIFPHIIRGIESVVVSEGHSLLLYSTGGNVQAERRALEMALHQGVDGLIVEPSKSAHPNPNIDLYLLMERSNIPFVMMHSSYVELNSSVVVLDDIKGAYLATSLLFDLGHRTVGAIFKTDDAQGCARFRGFVKAHQDYHVPIQGQLIKTYATEDKESIVGHFVAVAFHDEELVPTAVVCYNDEIAIVLIRQLRELGLNVPGDISVTGFDDSTLADNGFVHLTTVKHPKQKMGEAAAAMLFDLLRSEETMWTPREQVFEPELVVRSSTRSRL